MLLSTWRFQQDKTFRVYLLRNVRVKPGEYLWVWHVCKSVAPVNVCVLLKCLSDKHKQTVEKQPASSVAVYSIELWKPGVGTR